MYAFNLWRRLVTFLALTTTDFIVKMPLAGGKFRLQESSGTNYMDVSVGTGGSPITVFAPSAVGTPYVQFTGFTALTCSQLGLAANLDTNLSRLAAGVAGHTSTWVVNHPGTKRLTANVGNATVSMVNLTDLSVTLIAGRKYVGKFGLFVSNSVAAEGISIDFNGGASTVTSMQAAVSCNIQGATAVVSVSEALTTDLTFSTMNGTAQHYIEVTIGLVCNSGGTFIPRFSPNARVSGTATAFANSFLILDDSAN